MSTATLASHEAPSHGAPPAVCRFGMVIFLLSEAMLFAGLIAAYIVVRWAHQGVWPPEGAPNIQLQLPPDGPTVLNIVMIINSIILISSSVTYHFAEAAIKKHGKSGLPWMLVTIALGSVFLTVQGWEWMHLRHEGMWFPVFSTEHHQFDLFGIYGSTFFAITGFHGMHVFVGLLLILWVALRQAFTGCFSPKAHSALDNVGIYWHFVDGVWIVVYTLLYVV